MDRAVQVIKNLAAIGQRHQGPEHAGRLIPPQFQITYLLGANLQSRLVKQLLYLEAQNLLQGHLFDVQGREVPIPPLPLRYSPPEPDWEKHGRGD
jgi:hypothetical protein